MQNIIHELSTLNKKREKELVEMDRTAKMLIRRDLDLTEMRDKREKELDELKKSKSALTKMLKEIQEAREKAEEERDKTMAVFTNFTDGLLLFNKELKVDSANSQAEKFLGVEATKMIGKSITDLSKIAGLESVSKLFEIACKSEFITKEGLELHKELFVEISNVPLFRGKEKWATLIIMHDVTREKMVEKTKTEFVSIAAHQLRTPLSAIKWTLKMFLDGDLGEITKEQKEYLTKSYKTNEVMIALINDLLNVARMEEGRFLYNPILVNMRTIVESTIDLYKVVMANKKIEFEYVKPENELPNVVVDVEKISLVVQNLLDNAIRYSLVGGKVILALKYDEANKEIEVSVSDKGIGIPKNMQSRIFSKFFRSPSAVRLETEGSGLGLFIAKNIVDAHAGKIWFESEEGRGTTFYFKLPISEKTK